MDQQAGEMLANMMRGWPRDATGLPVPPGDVDDIAQRLDEIQGHVQDLERHAIDFGFWPKPWENEVEWVSDPAPKMEAGQGPWYFHDEGELVAPTEMPFDRGAFVYVPENSQEPHAQGSAS